MGLAYKGLYEIYWFFSSVKNDNKNLPTFCFVPHPHPRVVDAYAEKGRDGAWEFAHIQSQGGSRDRHYPP